MTVRRRTVPTLIAALVATAMLAAPAPADAQARKRSTTAAAPAASAPKAAQVPLPPPPAAPARVAAAAPVAPTATPTPAPRVGFLAVLAGPFVALDAGGGFAVTVDYGRTATPARWTRAELEVHLPITFAKPSNEEDVVQSFTYAGQTYRDVLGSREDSATLFEVVPTARVRMPLGATGRAAVFGDGGLGLVFGTVHAVDDLRFEGRTSTTDVAVAVALRLGAGIAYDATPRLRLLFQPVVLTFHAGTDWSSYTALAGLSYRL